MKQGASAFDGLRNTHDMSKAIIFQDLCFHLLHCLCVCIYFCMNLNIYEYLLTSDLLHDYMIMKDYNKDLILGRNNFEFKHFKDFTIGLALF
jgi:hypothetical protein